MNVFLSPLGGSGAQFFDNNGKPLSGGKLYSYEAGTTEPCATYTDNTGNTSHANPIILDSAGRIPGGEVWLEYQTSYKFVLAASNDAVIASWDNIASRVDSADDADTAGDADTLDGMHWIGTSPANGIKNYIDGGFILKPAIAPQVLRWTLGEFQAVTTCNGYLDLGPIIGARFMINMNAYVEGVNFNGAQQYFMLTLQASNDPTFQTGVAYLADTSLGKLFLDAGAGDTVSWSPSMILTRNDDLTVRGNCYRYVRLQVIGGPDVSSRVYNGQAMIAVQLTY